MQNVDYIESNIQESRDIKVTGIEIPVYFDVYSIYDQYVFIVYLGDIGRGRNKLPNPVKDVYTSTDDAKFNSAVLHLLPRIVKNIDHLYDDVRSNLHVTIADEKVTSIGQS